MSITVTLVTLVIAAVVFLWKRPRSKRAKEIWALCALSGIMGLLVPGGAFVLQAAQSILQGLLTGCCLLAVHKEYRLKLRLSNTCHLRVVSLE